MVSSGHLVNIYKMLLLPHFMAYCGQTWTDAPLLHMGCTQIFASGLRMVTSGSGHFTCIASTCAWKTSFPSSDRPDCIVPAACAICRVDMSRWVPGRGMCMQRAHGAGVRITRTYRDIVTPHSCSFHFQLHGKMLIFVLFILTIYKINKLFCSLTIHWNDI